MTHKEHEFTNIRDFTTLFHMIFRCESLTKCRVFVQFAIWSLGLSLSQFCFLQTLFLVYEQVISQKYIACLFTCMWFWKMNFDIHNQ